MMVMNTCRWQQILTCFWRGEGYHIGFIPVFDTDDHEVGDMDILYDVTDKLSYAGNSVIMISVICTVVGMVLFVSFSMILGRVEQ